MASAGLKVFLVGFMGAGKTTLGEGLAARLGWAFQDLDRTVEDAEGMPVARVFAERGEAHFRRREARELELAAARPERAVIACGGGAFCSPENRAVMHQSGITVWLDQPFERIWARERELAPRRPLMKDEASLRALYDERIACYRLARIHLPVREGGLDDAMESLLGLLESGEL